MSRKKTFVLIKRAKQKHSSGQVRVAAHNNNLITCLQPRVCSHKCYGLLCKTRRNTESHLLVNNSGEGVLVCSTPACRRRAILEMILHISSEACVTDLHQITSVSSHIPRSPRPADRNPGRERSLFQSFKMKK